MSAQDMSGALLATAGEDARERIHRKRPQSVRGTRSHTLLTKDMPELDMSGSDPDMSQRDVSVLDARAA